MLPSLFLVNAVPQQLTSYRPGRDCKAAILVDRYYLNSCSGNTVEEKMNTARSEIYQIMNGVNEEYTSNFNIGVPVVRVDYVDTHNDGGRRFDLTVPSSAEMLQKLRDSVASRQGIFGELYGMCAVFLLTYQNFANTVGYAYTGGACKSDGTNVGIVTAYTPNRPRDISYVTKLVTHEFGHLMGATHDGNGNNCQANGQFIMDPMISPGDSQKDLSTCSVDEIKRYTATAQCFINRGTQGYMQNNNQIPII